MSTTATTAETEVAWWDLGDQWARLSTPTIDPDTGAISRLAMSVRWSCMVRIVNAVRDVERCGDADTIPAFAWTVCAQYGYEPPDEYKHLVSTPKEAR